MVEGPYITPVDASRDPMQVTTGMSLSALANRVAGRASPSTGRKLWMGLNPLFVIRTKAQSRFVLSFFDVPNKVPSSWRLDPFSFVNFISRESPGNKCPPPKPPNVISDV